jgi:kinetochor protein Mis14/NSL1
MRRDAPANAAKDYANNLLRKLREDDDDEYNGGEEAVADAGNADVKEGSGSENEGYGNRRPQFQQSPDWAIHVPLGIAQEKERWCDGEMEDLYVETLRTLARLQGEGDLGGPDDGDGSKRLSATVGKVERARKAIEVVENTS